MEVSWCRGKRLYVSGTASIDGAGRTLHAADLPAQVGETFRVVENLLDSRGFSFADVSQAVCYVARDADLGLARVLAAQYLGHQTSMVRATICRPDLEFEVELVANRQV
jgi:enamine deaminase RidA (YjgF/YER057c/UK114 family)